MLPFHPVADLFPLTTGAEFDALVEDIRAHGLRYAIVVHPDGSILDGRNRARACDVAGVAPIYAPWAATESPASFVISMNLHRRHLTVKQKAFIAARLATLSPGVRANSSFESFVTQRDAARLLGVHKSSVARARLVLDVATPDEVREVEHGKQGLGSTAAKLRPLRQRRHRPKPAPAPPKEKPPSKTRQAFADRLSRMREMANRGASSRQIAKAVGLEFVSCRAVLIKHNVEVPADRIVGRIRQPNSTRIIEHTVAAAEDLTSAVSLIEFDKVDWSLFPDWIDRLTVARRELDRFIQLLRAKKEPTNESASKSTDSHHRPSPLEAVSRAD